MSSSSKNYKKSLFQLRKINSSFSSVKDKKDEKHDKSRRIGNYYKHLLDENIAYEADDKADENNLQIDMYKDNKKEKDGNRKKTDFDDLPEAIINIILEFLPNKKRLEILKYKYNSKFIKCKLQKIPKNKVDLKKMWKCADIANNILQIVTDGKGQLFDNFSVYSLVFFKSEKNPLPYSVYYMENFTKIILAALRHYSRIYKNIHKKFCCGFDITRYRIKRECEVIEEIMLYLFANLQFCIL